MDLILISVWLVAAFVFLISLIASSYFTYVREGQPFNRAVKLIVALILYGLVTGGSGSIVGLTVFAGSHAEPPGSVLSYAGAIVVAAFLIVYGIVGWLLCSFIVGHSIKPVRLIAAIRHRK